MNEVSESSKEEDGHSRLSSDNENEYVNINDVLKLSLERRAYKDSKKGSVEKDRYWEAIDNDKLQQSNFKATMDLAIRKQYETNSNTNDDEKPNTDEGSLFSKNTKVSKISKRDRKGTKPKKQISIEQDSTFENADEDLTILIPKKSSGHKQSFDDFPIEMIKKKSVKVAKKQENSDQSVLNDDESLAKITESNEIESVDNKQNNQQLLDFDEEIFRRDSSDGDQMDILQLQEIEEKVDKSRASTPDWELDFTPRQIFFMNKNIEDV